MIAAFSFVTFAVLAVMAVTSAVPGVVALVAILTVSNPATWLVVFIVACALRAWLGSLGRGR